MVVCTRRGSERVESFTVVASGLTSSGFLTFTKK